MNADKESREEHHQKRELTVAVGVGVFLSIVGIMLFAAMAYSLGNRSLFCFGLLTLLLTWVGLLFRTMKARK